MKCASQCMKCISPSFYRLQIFFFDSMRIDEMIHFIISQTCLSALQQLTQDVETLLESFIPVAIKTPERKRSKPNSKPFIESSLIAINKGINNDNTPNNSRILPISLFVFFKE